MAESVSKLRDELLDLTGVDIQLDEDTFKSTYQILKEISEVWDDLSDISRANVTELIAGRRFCPCTQQCVHKNIFNYR